MIKKLHRYHYIIPSSFYTKIDDKPSSPSISNQLITSIPILFKYQVSRLGNFKKIVLPKIDYISNDLTFGYGSIYNTDNKEIKQVQIVKLFFDNSKIKFKILATHETKSISGLTVNDNGTKILYFISYGGNSSHLKKNL